MTPAEIGQLVEELYLASGRGDWPAVEAMLTDDFTISEADSLPMACRLHGKGALRELYALVTGMMDVAAFERTAITVGGDYAIAIVTVRFADPALAPAELCELFHIRDGKVCEIKPFYYDPAPMVAAAAAKAAA